MEIYFLVLLEEDGDIFFSIKNHFGLTSEKVSRTFVKLMETYIDTAAILLIPIRLKKDRSFHFCLATCVAVRH